jgi:hypothetical protein
MMRTTLVRMLLALDVLGVATFFTGLVALLLAGERVLRAEED